MPNHFLAIREALFSLALSGARANMQLPLEVSKLATKQGRRTLLVTLAKHDP